MGDIRRQRKKFSKPGHPWNKERIVSEKALMKEYGLRRKNEIWKMTSILSNFARLAKELIKESNDLKRNQLIGKLISLGLLNKESRVEDTLSIKLNDIMERRLQTIVVRKNLARSMNQARQLIVHEHIAVGDKKITIPSYLVRVEEESLVSFAADSNLNDPEHPERFTPEQKPEEKEVIKAKKEKESKKKDADKKKDYNKKEDKKVKEDKKKPKTEEKKEEAKNPKKTEDKKEEKSSE